MTFVIVTYIIAHCQCLKKIGPARKGNTGVGLTILVMANDKVGGVASDAFCRINYLLQVCFLAR